MTVEATFAFVRHGDAPRLGARQLTELGRRQAREAGAWLAAQGFRPDRGVSTRTPRTRDTLALALQAWPDRSVPTRAVLSGFSAVKDLPGKLDAWGAGPVLGGSPPALLFSGHHSSQQALNRLLVTPPDRRERMVLVGGWVAGRLVALAAARWTEGGFVELECRGGG